MKLFEKIYDEAQMEEYHIERMTAHRERVRKYLIKFTNSVSPSLGWTENKVNQYANKHDEDKFFGDMLEQYKKISWMYKCKLENVPCDIEYTQEMDDATKNHILTNDHHPEFWDDDYTEIKTENFEDRDKTIITRDGTRMSNDAIVEMVCDWKATGDERGNSVKSWIKKCIDENRYKFTNTQWMWIKFIANHIED